MANSNWHKWLSASPRKMHPAIRRDGQEPEGSAKKRYPSRKPGRPKGGVNKITLARERALAEQGLMPLDYLLSLVRDESVEQAIRIDAAKAAAPFCHPRLSAIAVGISSGPTSPEDRAARVLELLGIGGDPADPGGGEDRVIEAEAVDLLPGDGPSAP